jgi:cytochrome c5
MSGEHTDQSLIKTPRQLVTVVVIGFVVPVLVAALIAYLVVTGSKKVDKDQGSLDAGVVSARIKPVAEVTIAGAPSGAAKAAMTGEQVVQQSCAACHMTGAAGAPKIGDKAAWAKRVHQGLDQLLKSAIAGKGGMPPKGGASDLSDLELARAIVHMANLSGGSLKEPAGPRVAAEVPAGVERSGEQVVQAVCTRCHETGLGGAPKIGDKAAWSQRISQGVAAVTKSAIRGHGKMPARGGLADLTDAEVTRAILFMFGRAGDEAKLKKTADK